jgi:hypothetical protein
MPTIDTVEGSLSPEPPSRGLKRERNSPSQPELERRSDISPQSDPARRRVAVTRPGLLPLAPEEFAAMHDDELYALNDAGRAAYEELQQRHELRELERRQREELRQARERRHLRPATRPAVPQPYRERMRPAPQRPRSGHQASYEAEFGRPPVYAYPRQRSHMDAYASDSVTEEEFCDAPVQRHRAPRMHVSNAPPQHGLPQPALEYPTDGLSRRERVFDR